MPDIQILLVYIPGSTSNHIEVLYHFDPQMAPTVSGLLKDLGTCRAGFKLFITSPRDVQTGFGTGP